MSSHSVPPYPHSRTPSYLFNLFFSLLLSSYDTSFLYLLPPLWLCSLVCHSGLSLQSCLVHREQNSFPHPTVSLILLSFFTPLVVFLNVTVSGSHSMTASGVPRPVRCVFAPEGVYPAALAPASLSAALGTRACSPQLESAVLSVAAMEVRVVSGSLMHTDFRCSLCFYGLLLSMFIKSIKSLCLHCLLYYVLFLLVSYLHADLLFQFMS